MQTKYYLLALSIFSTLVVFRALTFPSQTDSKNFQYKGQISSNPYLSQNRLVFNIGRYQISTAYQNLQYGDDVQVFGAKTGYKILAKKVVLLPKNRFEQRLGAIRQNLEQRINNHLPRPQADLLTGILLGIKSNLSREFKADLVATGTIHVVVVSGYNIVLLGSFILVLAKFFGRKKTSVLALIIILFYTFLVGFSAPTLRALIMGSLSLLAVLSGRRALAIYSLLMTALIMLLLNPEFMFDISFQLTFAATAGVILFTKKLAVKLKRLPNWLAESLATTMAAQILVLPLLFYYFGTVSLLSPVVNSIVLWTVPITTVLGFAFLVIDLVASPLANLVVYLLVLPLSFFVLVVSFFGSFKIFVLNFAKYNLLTAFGYYLIVLSLLPKVWSEKTANET